MARKAKKNPPSLKNDFVMPLLTLAGLFGLVWYTQRERAAR